jgi:hypothetical protein
MASMQYVGMVSESGLYSLPRRLVGDCTVLGPQADVTLDNRTLLESARTLTLTRRSMLDESSSRVRVERSHPHPCTHMQVLAQCN